MHILLLAKIKTRGERGVGCERWGNEADGLLFGYQEKIATIRQVLEIQCI